MSTASTKKTNMAKKNPRRRRHLHHQNLAVDIALDNAHLNAALRAACDDNALLAAANRNAIDQNSALSTALADSERELLERRRSHIRSVQDIHLDNIMERAHLSKQIETERVRLLRKLAADRKRAEEEEERLVGKLKVLEMLNVEMAQRAAHQIEINAALSDQLDLQTKRYSDALAASHEALEDLECSRQEATTVRDDLADLQRLHVEEESRREMGLPPAYGGLDDVDSAPWDRHCIDAGRLDGGSCAQNMALLESVNEEGFGRQLRKVQAKAGQLRLSNNPEDHDRAGAEMLAGASDALAQACLYLIRGVDNIAGLQTEVAKEPPCPPTGNPSFASSPQPTKKRRLSASPTDVPAKRPHVPIAPKIAPFGTSTQPVTFPPFPPRTPVSIPFPNHTLSHRAVTQILSLHWQIISTLELRALAISPWYPALRFKISRSFRIIEDSLRSAIENSAKVPLQKRDSSGRCFGCAAPGCALNCVRLGRLQGYLTQIQLIIRALRGIDERSMRGVLQQVHLVVEDIVGTERRCAGSGSRVVVDLTI